MHSSNGEPPQYCLTPVLWLRVLDDVKNLYIMDAQTRWQHLQGRFIYMNRRASLLSTPRSLFVVWRRLWFQPARTEDKARGMDREEWLDTKASLAGHWKMVPSPQQLSVLVLKPIATVAIMLWEWLVITACCVRMLRTVAAEVDSRNGWTPNLGFGRVTYSVCKQTDAKFRKEPRTSAESLARPKEWTGFWKHVSYAETGAFGKVSCMWHADIRAHQITYKTRNCKCLEYD